MSETKEPNLSHELTLIVRTDEEQTAQRVATILGEALQGDDTLAGKIRILGSHIRPFEAPKYIRVFVFCTNDEDYYWIAAGTPLSAALFYTAQIAEGGTCIPDAILQAVLDRVPEPSELERYYHEVTLDECVLFEDEEAGKDAEGNPIFHEVPARDLVAEHTEFPALLAICGLD